MATQPESWVVYLKTLRGHPDGVRAVCAQHEWEQMEHTHPGYHKFIQGGIATEREAELLARGTTGDPPPRPTKPR